MKLLLAIILFSLALRADCPDNFALGNASIGSTLSDISPSRKRASQFELSESAYPKFLSVWLEPGNVSQKIKGILYNDLSNLPNQLLSQSAELTLSANGRKGWYQLALPAVAQLPPGKYWLGIANDAFPAPSPVPSPSPSPAPGIGTCASPIVIAPNATLISGVTSGTSQTSTATYAQTAQAPEKVYTFTPTASGNATFQTCGNNTQIDSVVYVKTGGCSGTQVGINDDSCKVLNDGGNHGSLLTMAVTAGVTYTIVVDGWGGTQYGPGKSAGPFELKITAPVGPAPSPLPSPTPGPSPIAGKFRYTGPGARVVGNNNPAGPSDPFGPIDTTLPGNLSIYLSYQTRLPEPSCSCMDVTWEASEPGDFPIAGYNLKWGKVSGTYDSSLKLGASILTARAKPLLPNTSYCFAVSAFDTQNNESANSNELCGTTKSGQ